MRLFIGNITPEHVTLNQEEEHHIIKVLRMNDGEEIYVTDGLGSLVRGKISIMGKKISINVLEIIKTKQTGIDNKGLHIAIAPTKNIDRFDFFLEKSIELGISTITPILCANSERKHLNYEKVLKQAYGACKQCLRSVFPIINPLTNLQDFLKNSAENIYVAHCYNEFEKKSINQVLKNRKDLTILIGPEGDFSKKEIEHLYNYSATGISLGENRLRTETAGIFVASCYYYSNFH